MPLTLPNTFAGNPLDRASDRRRDADWLAAQIEVEGASAIALWNGAPLVSGDAQPELARIAPALAAELAGDGERLLFLGLDAAQRAVFALDLDGPADPSQGVLEGHGRFSGLRDLAAVMAADACGLAATAKAVFEWRRRHRFCANCGQPTTVSEGGWKRRCNACHAEHFPRTDPVVIMLPVRGDQCLLGRQASWPPDRFSALAGFMEPGEAIEAACAREIAEESGLEVLSVAYHSSQPWPFPMNLMIGLFAEVGPGEARPDQTELEAVRWATREEVRAMLRGEHEVLLPPPLAIAYHLIAAWAEA